MIHTSSKKIAIVHDFLVYIGGAERTLQAIHEIYPDADVFTLVYDKAGTHGKFENWKLHPIIRGKRGYRARIFRYPKLLESIDLSGYDLVISSSGAFSKSAIVPENVPHICYCHSPMRYVWDWYFEYLKEHNLDHGPKSNLIRIGMHRLRLWDKITSRRVNFWIANSSIVQDRIEKYYHAKADIIYPPVETTCTLASKEDYYFAYGRLSAYKKFDLAIGACQKLGKKLLICGEGDDEPRLKKLAGNDENIKFLGRLNDNELKKRLAKAKALIFPGEDDFGIVPVEANACGTPVIAYGKGGALDSQVDGQTAVFFKEPTIDSLAEAIKRFETLSFEPKAVRANATRFSKARFIAEFKSKIEEYVKRFKR